MKIKTFKQLDKIALSADKYRDNYRQIHVTKQDVVALDGLMLVQCKHDMEVETPYNILAGESKYIRNADKLPLNPQDLENLETSDLEYPDYEKVIPDINENDFEHITLSPKLLIKCLEMFKEQGKVHLYIKKGSPLSAIVMVDNVDTQNTKAVLMPMRNV